MSNTKLNCTIISGSTGPGSSVKLRSTGTVAMVGDRSVSLWFDLGTLNKNWDVLFSTHDSGDPVSGKFFIILGCRAAGHVLGFVTGGQIDLNNVQNIEIFASTKYHVVVTYKQSTGNLKAYLNDTLVHDESGITIGDWTDIIGIGNNTHHATDDNDFAHDGTIEEVNIFSRELTSGEVTTLYNSGNGVWGDTANAPFNSGFVKGWHYDDDSDQTPDSFPVANANLAPIDGETVLYVASDIAVNGGGGSDLNVTPTSLNASTFVGSSPANASFDISNAGSGTLNYNISSNASWLSASPLNGSSTGESDTINVQYIANSLANANYTGILAVSSDSATAPYNQDVTVALSVSTYPVIELSTTTLTASALSGSLAAPTTFTVHNSGNGTLFYNISSNASWLSASPLYPTISSVAGVAFENVNVAYISNALSVGVYSGTFSVSGNASNTPQTIATTLTISSTATTLPPGYPPVPSFLDASWSQPDPVSPTGEIKWVRHLRMLTEGIK